MRVDVVMPQMGESIAEGTITRWIKQLGESVQRDEPLFEISTDKVDAEIPSPAAGKLVEIKNQTGETVPVNQVVAVIETDASAAASAPSPQPAAAAAPPKPAAPAAPPKPAAAAPAAAPSPAPAPAPAPGPEAKGGEGAFVSPVVRKIADEHGIDPSRVPGTGAGGRVTKKDILDFVAKGAPPAAAQAPARGAAPAPAAAPPREPAIAFSPGARVERQAMSAMRKKIAEHMVESRRTSAHVHSVFEVDMSRVVKLRASFKDLYDQRHGTKLTITPFFVKAVCDALRAWPVVNASVEGEEIVYKKDLNIGIAVALDWGLIVPVVRNADELSLAGLAKRINDLAERARTKKLVPDEVQGGTFTITNPGIFGGLFGLPIINQPQVAILGIGGIEKRPVVVDDAIAIRSMMYMSMSYDHRIVDGAVADQFLAMVKSGLQEFDESLL
ncbi:MAG TPA: 2-oxoglutarate dehydrogenase, E2 component, dihydrolipoamide succinyltransferase [Candidatus Polarisedimenticolaceae bacterium]|nr:2-oxoglutarate dehydrogenase, E2 component, dihydrolipoamide succinyltransferase [Candidatus Polarisedimenticolaceae bacterium]